MILFLLLAPLSVMALTEQDIAKSVLTNFPLIEQAQDKYQASIGEQTAARGAFDHKLFFNSKNRIEDRYNNQYQEFGIERQTGYGGLGLVAGHRQGHGLFPPYDGKLATTAPGELFAGLTLPLLRNFKTDQARTDLELAKLDKVIAHAEIRLKKNIYLHKALSTYYKWVVANRKIKIRQENLRIAEERQKMFEKRFKAGDIEKLKLTDNERTILKRKNELAEAEIDLNNHRTALSLYYRDKDGKPILPSDDTLPVSITPKPLPKNLESAPLPQISVIEGELKKRDRERKLYEQSRLPGLNLDVFGAKDISGTTTPYDPSRLIVGLKFDFPIENRKGEGKTVAGEYKYRALQKERDYIYQELSRLFSFSEYSVQKTFGRWEMANEEFERTVKLSDAERRRFQQGASDLYIVNLREQDAAEADIKRWSVWYDYHQFHIDARLYSGRLADNLEAGAI